MAIFKLFLVVFKLLIVIAQGSKPYKCHSWTTEDLKNLKKLGGGVKVEKNYCEGVLQFKFTQGNDGFAPGCGSCWCCKPTRFQCSNWATYTDAEFLSFALSPSIIGENGRKCQIHDATACSSCACEYYVKYDIDGDATNDWLGLSFSGVPGGTGCCSSVGACSTSLNAAAWLRTQYQSYCCGPSVTSNCRRLPCPKGCIEIAGDKSMEKTCSCPGRACPTCCLYGCKNGGWMCLKSGYCRKGVCPEKSTCQDKCPLTRCIFGTTCKFDPKTCVTECVPCQSKCRVTRCRKGTRCKFDPRTCRTACVRNWDDLALP